VTAPGIPFVEVSGSHAAAGEGIGEATRAALHDSLAGLDDLPALRERARPFDAIVRRHLPAVAAELDGCARSAGLAPIDLVVLGTEELFSGCSDVAATAPATTGDTIVAHTNDLAPATEARLTAILRRVDGEPAIFTVGVGPFPSIAINDAGLALGGNQLDANDERVGIPRLLLVRDLIAARTSGRAIAAALHPARASSYNNLIAHRDGTLLSVEASATAHGFVDAVDTGGVTAHTNHYTLPALERFELDPGATAGSRSRLRRAWELLDARTGHLDEATLLGFIRDHEGDPQPICRHDGETSRTVFWCVLNPTAGRIRYGRGTPCAGDGSVFAF
jgi:hypothetical protein